MMTLLNLEFRMHAANICSHWVYVLMISANLTCKLSKSLKQETLILLGPIFLIESRLLLHELHHFSFLYMLFRVSFGFPVKIGFLCLILTQNATFWKTFGWLLLSLSISMSFLNTFSKKSLCFIKISI